MKANNKKATQITRGIVEYLKKTGQLNILPQLVKETLRKSQTQKDPSRVVVVTAIELGSSQLDEIKKTLSSSSKVELTIENIIDPEVLGGMKIIMGDKVIDNTIQNKLQNLGERLAQ